MHFNNPGRIKIFFKDSDKKNFLTIIKEVLVLWMVKKEIPMYYFKHIYKKGIKNYKDYLGTKEAARIHTSKKLHKSEYTSILHNKLSFAYYCENNGISTPKLLGHNFGNLFFSSNGKTEIFDLGQLLKYYDEIFITTGVLAIFFRPLGLLGGQGCFKIERDAFSQQLELQYNNLIGGNYTQTEVIGQHKAISAIHDSSINTLRILTYNIDSEVQIVSSFLRMGVGSSVVDNVGSGGLLVGINQELGTLKHKGYKGLEYGGEEFEEHPDSRLKFKDFKIPYFREACDLAKEAARCIPNGFVGWDIAITPNGPTIIEGNENPDLFAANIAFGGLLRNPHMQKVISNIS